MILVTGATGFLGSHLTATLLCNGTRVRALKRESSDTDFFLKVISFFESKGRKPDMSLLEWADGDVLDVVALENVFAGVDTVYHTASVVSFAASEKDNMMKTNVEGTANIVNAALYAKVKRFCHVSSTAALGRAKSGDFITEETEWSNSPYNTDYSVTKYLAELEVWRGIEEGLNAVIVNPSVILGFCKLQQSSGSLFRRVKQGISVYPTGVNAYVGVQDVVDIMIKLTTGECVGERFLVTAENLDYKTVLGNIANGFGKKAPQIKIQPWMLQVGWRVSYLLNKLGISKPFLTKQIAKTAGIKIFYRNDKVTKFTGHTFRSVEEVIQETCGAYRQFM